tara:strand:+ start:323 stop:2992 length:2670 start_codon:yes stop_codon:yes gene_type:complete
MKIFLELKVNFGILLSEKDSIIFPNSLAPELQFISNREKQIHHITDYIGNTKREKESCIKKIIKICLKNGYTHIFAGYGFMAEDYNFVSEIEKANLCFIGPNSNVIRQAGSKDEAKKIARSLKISVIPGEENISALTLLEKAGKNTIQYFRKLIRNHKLNLPNNWESINKIDLANTLLNAAYKKNIDLFSISDLQKKTGQIVKNLFSKYPGGSIRLKHVLGGGGKGQRVIKSFKEVPDAVMSVLVESKSNGIGDNKNFIIELNVENTRHVEIQVIGNGKWCSELGGRDCSVQMHEQKLLEFSITEEMLKHSAEAYDSLGKKTQAKVIRDDSRQLKSMCLEAEKFGKALKLDSVSTFECIVDKNNYYFMEVNTRIQVEHRVTEMAYKLKFTNPNDQNDTFYVNSLIGAMILIKCFGDVLPPPERVTNSISGIEARINSTNSSLNPHSGGIISRWTAPSDQEIRDDQGISKVNTFTGFSQQYMLSGAYDSNVALSVTNGISRKQSFEKLTEVFRRMEINGEDLSLNLNFIYGILHWFIANDTMLKPNTNFVSFYLSIAGRIKELSDQINLDLAWKFLVSHSKKKYGDNGEKICEQKLTLILRPLKKLFSDVHLLMGWIAFQKHSYNNKKIFEIVTPNIILEDLYHYLNLDPHSKKLPSDKIWDHDQKLLNKANSFYKDLAKKFEKFSLPWAELNSLLNSTKPSSNIGLENNKKLWDEITSSHKGHQLAMEILRLPILIAKEAGYFKLFGNDFLEVEIPHDILEYEIRKNLISKLSPDFSSNNKEIIASSGGIYYSRENPDANDFVKEGQHVKKGEVIGLLEVMKMFNEVRAKYSGTILKKCVENNSGVLVKKGQILFLIEPDEKNKIISQKQKFLDQQKITSIFMKKICSF